jgi:hypothetical protein
VSPAVEVVRLSQVEVAAPTVAAPAGLTAGGLDVSAGILLVRVADNVGVRGEGGADGATPSDRVFVQAQSSAALQQLARLALVGVTSVQESGDDQAPAAAELVAAPAETVGDEQPPAPTPPPAPPGATVRGMPSSSPLDTLFAMNPLLNRLGATAAGGSGALGVAGLLAKPALGPDAGGEGRPGGWLDTAAWVSACAALALASWGLVGPALRRRPDEPEETAALLN